MKFSLILATINRVQEVDRLLNSLQRQSYKGFELIIVDQNLDDRIEILVDKYKSELNIKHIRTPKGLSKSRNIGLSYATGDVVGFPDDDCWYPESLLGDLKDKFIFEGVDGLSIRYTNEFGEVDRKWPSRKTKITKINSLKNAISIGIFTNKDLALRVGGFNEDFGVGAGTRFGSGEETDFILKILVAKGIIFYFPDINLFHPIFLNEKSEEKIKKSYDYEAGIGKIFKMHGFPKKFIAFSFLRTLFAIMFNVLRLNSYGVRFYVAKFKGRISGYMGD